MSFIKLFFRKRKVAAEIKQIMNSGMFDAHFYTSTYDDVRIAGIDPVLHFVLNGAKEGRSPSKIFDLPQYLRDNPLVVASEVNPLVDWLTVGEAGGRVPPRPIGSIRPSIQQVSETILPVALAMSSSAVLQAKAIIESSNFFNAEYYRSAYEDVARSNVDPLDHYIQHGIAENRNPSPQFDTHFYLTQQAFGGGAVPPIDGSGGLRGLLHYLEEGRTVGLPVRPPHSVTFFADPMATVGAVAETGLGDFLDLEACAPVQEGAQYEAILPEVEHDGDIGGIITARPDLKIAIHLHLYYPEMCELFVANLASIERHFDIYVTTTTLPNRVFVENVLHRTLGRKAGIHVSVVENRGRDVAPLFVHLRQIWFDYDYVLHLHSKKSPHAGFGAGWLSWILRNLLGNKNLVEQSLAYLESNPACAMLFPDNYFEVKKFAGWGGNDNRISALLQRLGVESRVLPKYAHFPAGSMSWYRTSVFRSIMDGRILLNDFEPEAGQVEGTLAHVFERAMPLFAQLKGYFLSTFYVDVPPPPRSFLALHGPNLQTDEVGQKWLRDTPQIAANRPKALNPVSSLFNKSSLNISWIIPDFGIGAGGHMTIFRIVEYLEKFGHRQTIWIQNAFNHTDPVTAKRVIQTHYRKIGDGVCVRFLPDDTRQLSGDVVIATDCWTVFPAVTATNFKERFYFIQDYEPYFHPMGEGYLIAESTYNFGLAGLCAGEWLRRKAVSHGMWARKWELSSDPEFYFPANLPPKSAPQPENSIYRIVFYCRTYTPRRAVNLGLAAFEELGRRRRDFEVLMFGENPNGRSLSFSFKELGICGPQTLGELYRKCDVGVAFSTTNYSLVPLEMMACALPVVEIDADSTRTAYPEGSVKLVKPDPIAIADAIERLIDNEELRAQQTRAAHGFVSGLNWEHSARSIEGAILERLEEKNYRGIDIRTIAPPIVERTRKASVIIPTYNGGKLFREVLNRVVSQVCTFPFDVLVIDSSSTDNTAQFVNDFGHNVRLHSIPQTEFQHGRTRNLAISLTDGDIIAVLTQDAMPLNNQWLQKLVDAFDLTPNVAGVFGRHQAYAEHNPFMARDLEFMFDRFADLGPVFSLDQGHPSFMRQGSIEWCLSMHFYSDNNSAMRRSVWEALPYPEIDWGEDQVWAWEALKLGFAKVYANDAVVIHSHDFPYAKQMNVGVSEGNMFARYFGYNLHPNGASSDFFEELTRREEFYALRHGVSQDKVKEYIVSTRATIEGRCLGAYRS